MRSLYSEPVWAEIQKNKEDGELVEYHYKSDKGEIVYRFFKHEVGIVDDKRYYDITSYRGAEGPYIETVIEGLEKELLSDFRNEFGQYCKDNEIIAEFAKLDPWHKYATAIREVTDAEYYGNYYCNDLTRDFYNLDYNRRSKRSIRKAKEMGATVKLDNTGDTIEDFVRLYQNTEVKYHTNNYYNFSVKDIKRYFDYLRGRCFLINVVVDEKIITSVLVAYGDDVMHYLFLGNDPNYLEYQGNSLLTYETSLIGKELGLKIFDMGGGIPGGNVELFKRNFISDDGVWKYYAIKKIWNEEICDVLIKRKGEIKNPSKFPLYRG